MVSFIALCYDETADLARAVTLIPEEGNDELDGPDEDAPPTKKRITNWSQAIVKSDRFKHALQGSGRFAELVEKVSHSSN